MIMYYHIKLGESNPRYGLGASLIAIKDMLTHYANASSLKLPKDAYTNEDYHLYDYNEVKRLQDAGIIVYWANVYDSHLNTSTPFMIFYISNQAVVPIFILAPPSTTPVSRHPYEIGHSDDTVLYDDYGKMSKAQKRKLRLRMEMERRSLK